MKNFTIFFSAITIISILALLGSCSDNSTGDSGSDFDRPAMLANYGNNIIIPSYRSLKEAVDELKSAATDFSNDPTEANLTSLQNNLKTARLAWQDASFFQFGPAESEVLRTTLNTYPANNDKINSNIKSGDYNLGTLDNQSATGFPALGYLLHGVGSTNQEIAAAYTSAENAANRMTYLQDNVDFIKTKTDAVFEAWTENGGNYIATFLSDANAGTDVGSSLGMMVNALVLHYERFLRDGKIGIPAGVRSAGVPRPTAVEAFYGGYSRELAVANAAAIQRFFRGGGLNGSDGPGLAENLTALDAQDLTNTINTELDQAITALQNLNDPLAEQIENNNDPVLTAFQELQDGVVLLKADMASVLGVTITFQDNDGD